MLAFYSPQLKQSYKDHETDNLDINQIEKQINELKASTMELVQESVLSNTVGENVFRLKAMNDEIKALSDIITEYKNSKDCTDVETTINELEETLYNEPDQNDEYDDDLVRQLIDTIKVMEDDKLLIIFQCGITHEQPIRRNIRKSTIA